MTSYCRVQRKEKTNHLEGPTKKVELDICFEGLFVALDRDRKMSISGRNCMCFNLFTTQFQISIRVNCFIDV